LIKSSQELERDAIPRITAMDLTKQSWVNEDMDEWGMLIQSANYERSEMLS
jgi:hypothetical protein